jgi:hypothetical protein
MAGYPLADWQLASLALEARQTLIVAPRGTGKSRSLALLAAWVAFTRPGVLVMVVSAGEDAAQRLLRTVRDVAAMPELAVSVVDESASLLRLSSGSEVRSVPASERQIRGWHCDLLIVDEAARVPDDLLYGAALPTADKPGARIVLASSPWAQEGAFYRMFLAGDTEHGRVFRWQVQQAEWVSAAVLEHAKATMPPQQYRAEYEAEFVGAADAYFDPGLLLNATADYRMRPPADATGGAVVIGLDWGRAYDRHAIAALGVLDDHGRNEDAVLYVPFASTGQVSYTEQIAAVVSMAQTRRLTMLPRFYGDDTGVIRNGPLTIYEDVRQLPPVGRNRPTTMPPLPRPSGYAVVKIVSEMNGVGYAPTEELQQRMRGVPVEGMHTSQRSKEDQFGRLRTWLAQGRLVLPNDDELLRQMRYLHCELSPNGGLTIAASNPAIHDDAAMALALAASGVPPTLTLGEATPEPSGTEWLQTPGGALVPAYPRPRQAALRVGSSRLVSW